MSTEQPPLRHAWLDLFLQLLPILAGITLLNIAIRLKCDRNLPCENCQKRNQAQSCTYVHATLREKSSQVQKSGAGSKDVQSQIKHLEDLVISLMNQTTGNNNLLPQGDPLQTTLERSLENHAADEPIEQGTNASLTGTAESFGRISIEDEKADFKGDEHWVASKSFLSQFLQTLHVFISCVYVLHYDPHTTSCSVLVCCKLTFISSS